MNHLIRMSRGPMSVGMFQVQGPNSEKNNSGKSAIERIRLRVGLELLQLWREDTSLGVTFTLPDGLLPRHAGPTNNSFAILL